MKVFLKVLEKLKKHPICNNPAESALICKYNKGWNDAITKVEELICSYNVSDMWIPVDVKLPPEPKSDPVFRGDIYLVTTETGMCAFRAIWNGTYFTDGFEKLKVIAWMPMPEVYKEKKHE